MTNEERVKVVNDIDDILGDWTKEECVWRITLSWL